MEPPAHFDPQAVLADLLGNAAALRGVLGIFAAWHESTQAELEAALAAHDRARLQQLAHGVRGALLQLHAHHGAARAKALEEICAAGEIPFQPPLRALRQELEAIAAEVQRWLRQNPGEAAARSAAR